MDDPLLQTRIQRAMMQNTLGGASRLQSYPQAPWLKGLGNFLINGLSELGGQNNKKNLMTKMSITLRLSMETFKITDSGL